MATKNSSRRWLKVHFTDPYVKQAQKEGYRSRAIYKLLELHERYHLFKPGMTVIDLRRSAWRMVSISGKADQAKWTYDCA